MDTQSVVFVVGLGLFSIGLMYSIEKAWQRRIAAGVRMALGDRRHGGGDRPAERHTPLMAVALRWLLFVMVSTAVMLYIKYGR